MLHINELTYRIEGRPILEGATAAIPTGHKVGLVGRNGQVVARFSPRTKPESDEVVKAIESELAKK